MMSEYVLRTYGITKKIGKKEIVSNINLTVKRGEIYGLIGENGAGKSTLIRIITGLAIADKGEIELFGKKGPRDIAIGRRRIGSIIETPVFHPNLSVYQNLVVQMKQLGLFDNKAIDESLKLVGFDRDIDKKAKELSLGMKQRLGLALAIIGNPDFLILDEPINGLDPIGIAEIRGTLKRLCKEKNITVLITSHILGELSKLVNYYGVLHKGVLVEQISKDELYAKSQDYIKLKVDDVQRTSYIIENRFQTTKYTIKSNELIYLYDCINRPAEVNRVLNEENVLVSGISIEGKDIESYFFDVMRGKIHD